MTSRCCSRKEPSRECTLQFQTTNAPCLIFNSWTAICRGAVIHGMTVEKVDSPLVVDVQSRIARKSPVPHTCIFFHSLPQSPTHQRAGASYGIICQEKWDKNVHLDEDKFFDPQQRCWKATNQMKWLMKEVRSTTASVTTGNDELTRSGRRPDDGQKVPSQLLQAHWCR